MLKYAKLVKVSWLNKGLSNGINIQKILSENSTHLNSICDLDVLIEKIGDCKYVLLGEASHGTHEYYTWRTQISKKLIEKKGFRFIAVEGDWPDCYCLNRYVKNYPDSGKNAFEVLHAFNRWPTWMWANWEVVALIDWLRKYNTGISSSNKVGFYGLDVYSLWESLNAVIRYLDIKDPTTKLIAINALNCFYPYADEEGRLYANAAKRGLITCEDEVVRLLTEIRRNMVHYNTDPEAVMSAEQNAFVVMNAERYYRAMIESSVDSWNIRDHHMVDTLNRLMHFHGEKAKAIVWEHNTHVGDASATDMASVKMVNVGQLVNRRHHEDGVFIIGFGSYQGSVIAAEEWGGETKVMHLPKARPDSWEDILHQLGAKNRIVFMNEHVKTGIGKKEFGHRAVGVVYHPEFERMGNYVPSLLPYRYNAFIFLDESKALHPLHIVPDGHQMPETFPFGI